VGGIAVTVLPGFSALVYFWMFRETNQANSIFESPGMTVVAVTLLAAPLSITYAVLRHRLFELTFTVRKALQHTLARWFVMSLVPGISLFMIVATLLMHNQTVDAVLARYGRLFAVLTVAAFVIFNYRRRWLRAIDRRFFRERHYAYEVLADVATQVRRAGSIERAAPLVVARIESVLHPEFAAVLVRDQADRMFRSIAASPAAAAPPDLRDDSSLVLLARDTELPFDLSTDGGQALLQRLPAWDRQYIQQADIELLIRIVTPDDELHAMLAIGPKRSEEPYTDEDRGVLVTVAENLSMLVGREPPRAAQIPSVEECPKCGACFDAGSRICPDHAFPLVAVALPRTLGGRYRLNRRLATGGMGAVYEAFDTALEHDVAAKVVRDDMTSSRGAIERFFEEAKHVAKLRDHPNVVTLYDYGRLGEHQAYLIMELLQGRTLRQRLEAGPISSTLALSILEDVGAAIGHAHKHRLVHRDLKPENIFLVEHDRGTTAKVLDFGIAKPLSVATTVQGRPLTHDRVLVGTLEYMSPEQRRGLPPSKAWDLWSLALVALEMLSGVAPMQLMSPGLGPWHPGLVLKDTLPACVDVFNRALSIEPADRPTEAEAFCRDLAAALRARA
jgi:tRNA A-37 threonylcarbamoyl transferase component Bud32